MAKVKAITSETVNGNFVITDRATGDILDNNQGYGFKTAQKAYAAFGWKQKNLYNN